jgi:hypothetical protein
LQILAVNVMKLVLATADLNNSLGDERGVALSIYHQSPLMDITVLQNCVQ